MVDIKRIFNDVEVDENNQPIDKNHPLICRNEKCRDKGLWHFQKACRE